ncbi:MAG: hypothetical protein QHJ73_20245, partial [Armatimonadota bacterium]|nr:hypothetical protein [Armatimonadota bacterium]
MKCTAAPAQEVTLVLAEGVFRVCITQRGVSRLQFSHGQGGEAPHPVGLAREVAQQLREYFSGRRRSLDVPVDLSACPS